MKHCHLGATKCQTYSDTGQPLCLPKDLGNTMQFARACAILRIFTACFATKSLRCVTFVGRCLHRFHQPQLGCRWMGHERNQTGTCLKWCLGLGFSSKFANFRRSPSFFARTRRIVKLLELCLGPLCES